MSSMCNCCNEHVQRLSEQVSVMRKEIKNLRQMLESAVRANRKHMTSLQYAVKKIDQGGIAKCHSSPPLKPHIVGDALGALEQGNIRTVPIGHISSCFSVKNGTPRQPTICGPSRATLRIQQSVFNNPEHALVGLEHYSHVWVIFLFHKNGHLSYKAKVKPPRLNGQRVGVYSTRSPHRPNALGLTLAKLETIVGDTIYLSNIDMIAGTPVLDIKPYIPDYDSPHSRVDMETSNTDQPYVSPYSRVDMETSNTDQPYVSPHSRVDIETSDTGQPEEATVSLDNMATSPNLSKDLRNLSYGIVAEPNLEGEGKASHCRGDSISSDKSNVYFQTEDDVLHSFSPDCNAPLSSLPKDIQTTLEKIKAFVTRHDDLSQCRVSDSSKPKLPDSVEDSHGPCYGEEAYSTIAAWIREPPVASLEVRFTPHAQKELEEFLPPCPSEPSEGGRPKFRFLCSSEEAAAAIRGVLSADPRSVYRRTRCKDRLFYFTLDTADITCWFGQGFAEVLRVRHIEEHASV